MRVRGVLPLRGRMQRTRWGLSKVASVGIAAERGDHLRHRLRRARFEESRGSLRDRALVQRVWVGGFSPQLEASVRAVPV